MALVRQDAEERGVLGDVKVAGLAPRMLVNGAKIGISFILIGYEK